MTVGVNIVLRLSLDPLCGPLQMSVERDDDQDGRSAGGGDVQSSSDED